MEINQLINLYINKVVKPKQYIKEYKDSSQKLHKSAVSRSGILYTNFDKDLTKSKTIKKLIRKNLDKLKHDTWAYLNLTDNLYHEHEGVAYYSKILIN
jgi:hypothetical protein